MDEGARFPRPLRFLSDFGFLLALLLVKRKARCAMNKNLTKTLATAALVLATGCVTAGTWVNGCWIDGPLCTVCDGMKVVTHTYGTTICTHCNGTGIEPPANETVIVENTVICDTWGPVIAPPPPPPPRRHHEPRHHQVGRVVPNAPQPRHNVNRVNSRFRGIKNNARPAARPAGGGGRRGGGGHGGRR